MSDNQVNLTASRHLTHNVLWNFLGIGTPLLVAFVAIPILIKELGTERFGVLILAWMAVGYFNLFDLGLGRALTQLVARKLGHEKKDEIPNLIWTAMILMVCLGVLGALVVASLSPWLVGSILKIPTKLQAETLTAFYLLAASMPFVISSTGLRGIIEAHQRFRLINTVRIPLGIFTFLGPLAVMPFSHSLVPVVAVLVFTRLISWSVYAFLCLHLEPSLRHSFGIDRLLIKPLINFGGWMTVSNLISPLMTHMDRFLIGTMTSMTAVAYYATPYEAVSKIWIFPEALMGVMFPAFTTTLAQDKKRTLLLFNRAVIYTFLTLFPIILIIVTFAHEGLTLWLNVEFADNSTVVLQLLAVGVFINSLAHIPFGFVQSAGRPDLTAKLHLIELPVYLLTLWWLLNIYGIVGAAIAWLLRIAVDTICQFALAHRLLPETSSIPLRPILMVGTILSALTLGAIISGLIFKVIFLSLTLLIFVTATWIAILNPNEKHVIRSYLKAGVELLR